MTIVKNGSVSSYAAVAVAAALISAVVTWGATQFVATSVAQLAAGGAGQLLTPPLADLPGREVRISLLNREPGSKRTCQGPNLVRDSDRKGVAQIRRELQG